MDILKYSAVQVLNQTCAYITGGANTAANTAGYNAGLASGALFGDANTWQANGATFVCSQKCVQHFAQACNLPWCGSNWNILIPRMPNSTGTSNAGFNFVTGSEYCGFKVCATNFVGAASNTWTVPDGAQYARFQVWGAGGGGGSGCCCGGSTWGTSGAYASVIIPVVPGCQYVLCAGCAIVSPNLWGQQNGTRSCRSFVTGFGLCNFCAEGAPWKNHWCEQAYDKANFFPFCGNCRWASSDCLNSSGGCICNGGADWCYSNSCSSCGLIGFSASSVTLFYGCYNGPVTTYGTSRNIAFLDALQVTGLPGLNGCMCFDTGWNAYSQAPPTYGYESVSQCSYSVSSTCGGLCANHAGFNCRRVPGAGGTATFLYGGCTVMCDPSGTMSSLAGYNCGGDIGRSGMVCVTWF